MSSVVHFTQIHHKQLTSSVNYSLYFTSLCIQSNESVQDEATQTPYHGIFAKLPSCSWHEPENATKWSTLVSVNNENVSGWLAERLKT